MVPGSMLYQYRIVSRLGAGGMGEVYLAQDERLDRPVALKILTPAMANDADNMRRFAQEAKAAASINHPNIAHIYENGEAEGVRFLAMEYVDGRTLSEVIHSTPLSCERILDIGIQVADALEEAHSKGILHRDIKPANIMLTSRDQVKVLDFGLAKILPTNVRVGGDRPTDSGPTQSLSGGAAVGTLHYMSPEQALGRELDKRTDIFSLGAVLYEMATGHKAFPGDSAAAIFDSLLNKEPASPRRGNHELSDGLERVIWRALEKDRDLRFQTVSDLRAELKRLRRDSSTGHHVAPEPRTRWSRVVTAALAFAGIAAVGGGLWLWKNAARPVTEPMQTVPLTTYQGSEMHPSFSPDGNRVAFSWNEGSQDRWSIYVKVLEAGAPLRLTDSPATELSPAWSPDGRYIAFFRTTETSAAFMLTPALPGMERKLGDANPDRTGLDSPFVAWTPDGKTLAISDKENLSDPMSIWLLNVESGQRRRLTNPPAGMRGDSSLIFSPDGKRLAFVRTGSIAVQDIYIVSIEGGEPKRLTTDRRRIFGIAWNAADNTIVFTSNRPSPTRLHRISPEGGTPERISGLGEVPSYITISRDGHRLAYTRTTFDSNIWRFPISGDEEPTALAASTRQEQQPQYSPDGKRLAFASARSGAPEIWLSDANGVNATQLTFFNGPATGSAMWSPDGRFIVFDSRPGGNPDVYIVSAEGGTARRFTTETSEEVVPSWSRDGKWIYFGSNRGGSFQIWKMPVDGGPAIQVTKFGGFHGVESPDGKYLYYAKATSEPGLWRIPVAGGDEEAIIPAFSSGLWGYWAITDKGLYYVEREDKPGNRLEYFVKFLALPSRNIKVIRKLERRPFNSGLALSPDGKYFLYVQVDHSDADIMMVKNFR